MAGLREGAQRLVREAWGLAAGPREGPSGWSTPPPPLGDERWGRAAGELLHLRQLDSQLAKCFYHLLIHHDSGGVSHRNLLVSHTGSQLHQTEHENRRKIEGGGGWGGGKQDLKGVLVEIASGRLILLEVQADGGTDYTCHPTPHGSG